MNLYYYDLETYPNCFLFSGKFRGSSDVYTFEISDRMNQRNELLSHLSFVQNSQVHMIGFNTIGFDYHILHDLFINPYTFTAMHAHLLGSKIIQSQGFGGGRGSFYIPMKERIVPQIDLFKINHFDNVNKGTSLKALQFAMRSASVEDLPFAIRALTFEEMDELRAYNVHDVLETEVFGEKNLHLIQMRQELIDHGVLSGDVLNYSDVKIGTEYLIRKIGRAKCFVTGNKPKQTIRSIIDFKNIILPKIQFRSAAYNAVLEWFRDQTIYIGRDERPKLETNLANLQFHFGLGGVHASVEQRVFKTDETHVIKDIDVSGMYVAVAIANGFAPEHLGRDFSIAYKQLQADRAQHKKETSMNKVLKLAGNGVYGNSNNTYSCFYDPHYTYSVTVNGQLQLIQLVELLSTIPGLQIIQANTDGITAFVPRALEHFFHMWTCHWEMETGLKLEEMEYSDMWIRDVNNYVARKTNGEMKRKGAYWYPEKEKDYEGWWNKDYSNMSAQKAIEQVLIHGYQPIQVLRLMTNPFDFMLRYKATGQSKVYIGDKVQLKTVRYYVSTKGEPMKKIAPPTGEIGDFKRKNSISDAEFHKVLKEIPKGTWDERIHTKNKSKYAAVTTSVESGRLVRACNRASDFNWADVDWDYYANEVEKLKIGG